ncbi:MAG: CRISPR system precrRNA processing endoribonuclease RAMP protein Cas6 [Erysipelotrichia bacterium]|nr:CRISPR system precrRNA processing endoribonuclease RAMP protein Cas6 [Erysipelotrichia bacterium]
MRYLRMRFRFRSQEAISFPPNPVNTFRGALGFQLLRIACIQRKALASGCKGCVVFGKCAYAQCYETGQGHINEGFSRTNEDMPHLMVIDTGFAGLQTLTEGSLFDFTVQLYGCAVEASPYLIVAARNAGMTGLTQRRVPCNLEEVIDDSNARTVWSADADQVRLPLINNLTIEEPDLVLPDDCELKMRFITPVAFKDKANGSLTLEPEFSRIVGSLLRRYSAFEASDGKKLNWDFAALTAVARQIRIAGMKLEPVYWERFSTRQQQRIPVSGVIGQVTYVGPVASFQDLLKAGEIIRCGRSTTFGQGKISITCLNRLNERKACDVFCD